MNSIELIMLLSAMGVIVIGVLGFKREFPKYQTNKIREYVFVSDVAKTTFDDSHKKMSELHGYVEIDNMAGFINVFFDSNKPVVFTVYNESPAVGIVTEGGFIIITKRNNGLNLFFSIGQSTIKVPANTADVLGYILKSQNMSV